MHVWQLVVDIRRGYSVLGGVDIRRSYSILGFVEIWTGHFLYYLVQCRTVDMWRGPTWHVLCVVVYSTVDIWRGEGSVVFISFVDWPVIVDIWRACFCAAPYQTVDLWRG